MGFKAWILGLFGLSAVAALPSGHGTYVDAVTVDANGAHNSYIPLNVYPAKGEVPLIGDVGLATFWNLRLTRDPNKSVLWAPDTIANSSRIIIGGREYGKGVLRLIGMGFNDANRVAPTYIGMVETDDAGATKGDVIIGTRNSTDAKAQPVERIRITGAGDLRRTKSEAVIDDNSFVTLGDVKRLIAEMK